MCAKYTENMMRMMRTRTWEAEVAYQIIKYHYYLIRY